MAKETVGTMKDRVAIITGGSRGLGRNTALNLARRGVNIIFTYRSNQEEADSLIREIEAMEKKAAGLRLETGDIKAFDGFVADVRKMLHGWGARSVQLSGEQCGWFAPCEFRPNHRSAI